MYDSLNTTKPKARKQHQCFWCCELILKGEQYVREVGIFEGDFQSTAYHMECDKAVAEWFAGNPEDSFPEGNFKRGSTTPR